MCQGCDAHHGKTAFTNQLVTWERSLWQRIQILFWQPKSQPSEEEIHDAPIWLIWSLNGHKLQAQSSVAVKPKAWAPDWSAWDARIATKANGTPTQQEHHQKKQMNWKRWFANSSQREFHVEISGSGVEHTETVHYLLYKFHQSKVNQRQVTWLILLMAKLRDFSVNSRSLTHWVCPGQQRRREEEPDCGLSRLRRFALLLRAWQILAWTPVATQWSYATSMSKGHSAGVQAKHNTNAEYWVEAKPRGCKHLKHTQKTCSFGKQFWQCKPDSILHHHSKLTSVLGIGQMCPLLLLAEDQNTIKRLLQICAGAMNCFHGELSLQTSSTRLLGVKHKTYDTGVNSQKVIDEGEANKDGKWETLWKVHTMWIRPEWRSNVLS